MKYDTVVVGGGPAGLIAAYFRAKNGENVVLLERNEKLGKKLYITGKGRCNVTNCCEPTEFLENVVVNSKFLRGAIYSFTPSDFMEFLSRKVKLKVERGHRVFPESDKASDITKALDAYCREEGVQIVLDSRVTDVKTQDGRVSGVITTDGKIYSADNVVLCTGGVSYPTTGSSGDGYEFAKRLGHTIISPVAALCGFNLKGDDFKKLQGVTLKNVSFTASVNGKVAYSQLGEILFTHFGVSGPLVLSASSYLNRKNIKEIEFSIDLKPALSEEQLDARIVRDFEKYSGKSVKNSLDDLLLKSLIPIVLKNAGINSELKNSVFTRENRKILVKTIKNLKFYPSSLRDVNEAIVTSGGVSVKEINPSTMESKLVKGLYFAGEIIDVDALTGGFNVTIAASTGYRAGNGGN